MRHAFVSWLVENGKDLYDVCKLLGHSNIIMTQRYSHLGENSLRMAVARLEEPSEVESKVQLIQDHR